MQTILDIRRLRWLGHVERMPQDNLLKAMLYSQLNNCLQFKGRPKLQYSDKVKKGLKKFNIPPDNWKNPAHNCSVGKSWVKTGVFTMESHKRAQGKAHRWVKKQSMLQLLSGEWTCSHPGKVCHLCIRLFPHPIAKHHWPTDFVACTFICQDVGQPYNTVQKAISTSPWRSKKAWVRRERAR